MQLRIAKTFQKDYRKIRDKKLLRKAAEIIEHARKAESSAQIANLKKMKGYKDFYRIRIGNYRIGIQISGNNITFLRLVHRKDIYSRFP